MNAPHGKLVLDVAVQQATVETEVEIITKLRLAHLEPQPGMCYFIMTHDAQQIAQRYSSRTLRLLEFRYTEMVRSTYPPIAAELLIERSTVLANMRATFDYISLAMTARDPQTI